MTSDQKNIGTSTPETATPEPTGPARVKMLGGSPNTKTAKKILDLMERLKKSLEIDQ